MLEAVLSRVQMLTLDLQRTNLEDEGVIALCEMVEFYGCASRVILSGNNRLRPRAWLTIGRMLKKVGRCVCVCVGGCVEKDFGSIRVGTSLVIMVLVSVCQLGFQHTMRIGISQLES